MLSNYLREDLKLLNMRDWGVIGLNVVVLGVNLFINSPWVLCLLVPVMLTAITGVLLQSYRYTERPGQHLNLYFMVSRYVPFKREQDTLIRSIDQLEHELGFNGSRSARMRALGIRSLRDIHQMLAEMKVNIG